MTHVRNEKLAMAQNNLATHFNESVNCYWSKLSRTVCKGMDSWRFNPDKLVEIKEKEAEIRCMYPGCKSVMHNVCWDFFYPEGQISSAM